MLGEVISTAGPNHMNCCDSYNFMAKFNYSSPLSNVFNILMLYVLQVSHFKEFIPKAFPSGDDLILDAEVLLIDTNTGNPLPFGSLGKHKVSG